MAIPADYTYSNGAYFKKSDGSGPYTIDDDGVAALLTAGYLTDVVANKDLYTFADGAYFKKATNAGPYVLTSS